MIGIVVHLFHDKEISMIRHMPVVTFEYHTSVTRVVWPRKCEPALFVLIFSTIARTPAFHQFPQFQWSPKRAGASDLGQM
jgi:hypothetical protein